MHHPFLSCAQQGQFISRSVGWHGAENLGAVADSIDESFHNAEFETETLTESDTLANYVSAIGDVRTIIYVLCLVVLMTVLLIATNSMTMLMRDRINEVAVMRAR